jgi:hypothetical protein
VLEESVEETSNEERVIIEDDNDDSDDVSHADRHPDVADETSRKELEIERDVADVETATEAEDIAEDDTSEQDLVEEPAVRRSTRERRKPIWYGDYHVNQLVDGSVDPKLKAVTSMITTGALDELSPDIIHKIIQSVLHS